MAFECTQHTDTARPDQKRPPEKAWRCRDCGTIYHWPEDPVHCDICAQKKARGFRLMTTAQARSTVVLLDEDQDGQRLSINGHYLEDARAVRIEKAGDRICVSFQLETKQEK